MQVSEKCYRYKHCAVEEWGKETFLEVGAFLEGLWEEGVVRADCCILCRPWAGTWRGGGLSRLEEAALGTTQRYRVQWVFIAAGGLQAEGGGVICAHAEFAMPEDM